MTNDKDFVLTADNKIFIAKLPLDGQHWIVFGKTTKDGKDDEPFVSAEFSSYEEAYAYADRERCHVDKILTAKLEFFTYDEALRFIVKEVTVD